MCEMLDGETMSEIEKSKKEIEALKTMVTMQTATIEVMKNFHEAEKAMLVQSKEFNDIYEKEKNTLREGEYIIDKKTGFANGGYVEPNHLKLSGVVHRGYCINTKTGEDRDSIEDFLKDAKIGKTED